MASTWAAIELRARAVRATGSARRSSAISSTVAPRGTYMRGSCADVWSVTTSISAPLASSSGTTSAALPRTAMESGVRLRLASSARSRASSTESATTSR